MIRQLILAGGVFLCTAVNVLAFAQADAWTGLGISLLFGAGGLLQWAHLVRRAPDAEKKHVLAVLSWILTAQIGLAFGGMYAERAADYKAQLEAAEP